MFTGSGEQTASELLFHCNADLEFIFRLLLDLLYMLVIWDLAAETVADEAMLFCVDIAVIIERWTRIQNISQLLSHVSRFVCSG